MMPPSVPGVPALRAAIAAHQHERYGIALDPATQVQVTFGATEALACALLALVRPGDEVAMLDPSYDAYGAIVARAGGVARPGGARASPAVLCHASAAAMKNAARRRRR